LVDDAPQHRFLARARPHLQHHRARSVTARYLRLLARP
jgi:hypothetical protein